MKRICVYSDVHGNIEALQKLLQTDDYQNADLRIFLGDAVMMCPHPNECLKTLFESKDILLMGNHDIYMAYGLPEEEFPYFSQSKRDHQAYMRNITDENLKRKLKTLPKKFVLMEADFKFHFSHYVWETEKLVVDAPKKYNTKTLDKLFDGVDANYIVFGHEHEPFMIESEKATYVCIGSLGIKYPSRYVVIEIDDKDVKFEFKQIDFDVEKLKKEMISLNYPRAEYYTGWFDYIK